MILPRSLFLASAIALLSGLLSACSTSSNSARVGRFDPRAASEQAPEFTEINRDQRLQTNLLSPPLNAYQVGVGDVLDIEIAGFLQSRTRTFVLPDGTLYFDLAEAVKVEHQTLAEIKTILEKELAKRYAEPEVHINLIESKSQRVMVLGQVTKPGTYSIARPTTVLEALADAGGFSSPSTGQSTELADLSNTVLIRDGAVLPIDFEALVKAGDMNQNVYVQPGDYIFVPSANLQSIQVLGSVRSPRTIEYTRSTTMISAIAQANGALPAAQLSHTALIRGSLQKPRIATVDVGQILSGKDANFLLKPGDIVWVPDRPWRPLERYVYNIIDAAARTTAVNEGARLIDEDARPSISISASGSQ